MSAKSASPLSRRRSFATIAISLLSLGVFAAGCGSSSDGDAPLVGGSASTGAAAESAYDEGTLLERYGYGLARTDPLMRHQMLSRVYSEVTAEDLPGMLEIFKQDLRRRRPNEIRVFANLLARHDREGALEEVIGWDYPAARTFGAEEVMTFWVANGNVEAARETWRKAAEDSPIGVVQQGELALIDALSRQRDFDSLLSMFSEATDVDHRRRMVAKATLAISQSPGKPYVDWAEEVHQNGASLNPDLKTEMILQAVRVLLLGEPSLAVNWYEKIKDGPYSGDALSLIGEKWGRQDPVAALEFLNARPESENPGMAKRAVAFVWLQSDAATAKDALRKRVDEDPGMASAIFPLVQFMMLREVPEAMELAKRVPDAKERDIVLKQGLMRWVQMDEDAVDRFIAEYPVSDAIKRAVKGASQLGAKRRAGDGEAK